jgi:4-amino-4-deoxy-L-arabinose transferase-like glycosyltransferase
MTKQRKSAGSESISNLHRGFFRKNHMTVALVAVLFTALLLRILALISLKDSIYYDYLLWDERIYHEWAKKIAFGTFHSQSVYEFPPLFAYLTAFIYWLFSADVFNVRLLNVALGVLTCFFIYLIGASLDRKKTGIIAALIAAFYGPFILYSIVPLKEILGTALFALTIVLFIRISVAFRLMETFLLGIVAGFMINVRPNMVILLPVFALFIIRHGYREEKPRKKVVFIAILYCIGLFLAASPFLVRNYLVAGKIALTTSQAGFNLYLANNTKNPDPYSRPVSFATTSPFEQGIQFTIEASRRNGEKLSPQEASWYWIKETVREISDNPKMSLRKMFLKILVPFHSFEASDHYNIDFMGKSSWFFGMPLISFGAVLPFAAAGILLIFRANRSARIIAVIIGVYLFTLIIFFTNDRYRLPLIAVLIPFAVIGVQRLYTAFRTKEKTVIYSGIGIIAFFSVIAYLPVSATKDMTAYHNTHAILLNAGGYKTQAIAYWKKSSDMRGSFSDFANLSLARRFFQQGDTEQGGFYLERIRDDSYAAALKYGLLGDFFFIEKLFPQAVASYEKALTINSGLIIPGEQLVDILRKRDPEKAAIEERQLDYIKSFYDLM